mmetsp:Transcript_8511/g.18533  ORF Transcript_8511/g.18533 Transcript_8511/m.18533 type:complete len:262 (+) Transcript_8511:1173-1958(+)
MAAASQQRQDLRAEGDDMHPKLGQGRDRSGTHRGVLENDAVVDEANVLGGTRRLGSLCTEKMKDLSGEQGELAVLYELAEMDETSVLGLGNRLDERDDALHNALLEVEAALFPQCVGEEGHEDAVLCLVLDAQRPDRLHNDNLELVGDLAHKGGDLLHEAFHGGLGPRLEEGGDGEGGDAPVGVRDHRLQVQVARRHTQRVDHGNLVQRPHAGETQSGLGGGEEQLENGDGGSKLADSDTRQVADGPSGLADDHLRLVTET